jgi:hypothetical protein
MMIARRFLTTSMAILMVFAFSTVRANEYIDDASDYDWDAEPVQAGEGTLVNGVFSTVTGSWDAVTGFFGAIMGNTVDTVSQPFAQSTPPKSESNIEYKYVPRHSSGNPKWRSHYAK